MAYATSAERMLAAIGDPEHVDTSEDSRLSRIFLNRTLRVFPAFKDFYGMEDAIEQIEGKKVDSSYDFGDGQSSKRFFDIISKDKVWNIDLQKYFVEMNNEN